MCLSLCLLDAAESALDKRTAELSSSKTGPVFPACLSTQAGWREPGGQEAPMRKGYGQFCPVAKGAEVFAERWTPLVLRELLEGSTRFNDLHRGVPLMSRSMLSIRLKRLEDIGVVTRKSSGQGTEYHLTEQGREFAPIIRLLGEWGQRWYRTTFD